MEHLVEHHLPHLADDVKLAGTELAKDALKQAPTPFTVTLEAVGHMVLLGVQDGSPCHPVVRLCMPHHTSGR